MSRMYIPKAHDAVRFLKDYYAPISNYEIIIPAGTTGTVVDVDENSYTNIKLDTHFPDLDEWDNDLQFNPDLWGDLTTSRRLDRIAMLTEMADLIEVTNRPDAIIEVQNHLTEEDNDYYIDSEGAACPFCGHEMYSAIGVVRPGPGPGPGRDCMINPVECLRCLRRWNEVLLVMRICEPEGQNP